MEVRHRFIQALRSSINVLNRPNKLVKAGYSSSEDALTWTMFRFLESKNRLRETFAGAGVSIAEHASCEPRLILWGAEVPSEDGSPSQVPAGLHRVSCLLQEAKDRCTEPDVVLDFGLAGIVFVEVKFRSGNEIKSSQYDHLERYLGDREPAPFKNPAQVRINGHYELARNWRIAWSYPGRSTFRLLSLTLAMTPCSKVSAQNGSEISPKRIYIVRSKRSNVASQRKKK
jgi:hypothetical protein